MATSARTAARSPSRACKDCGSTTRKVVAPGPRCVTCRRARTKAQKEASWAAGILKRYGITAEQYEALYEAQGGVCYICQRATGRTRRLSVDHDHRTGYVRGLCCRVCNNILGHFRDDPTTADRVGMYLREPPAFGVIGRVKADGSD